MTFRLFRFCLLGLVALGLAACNQDEVGRPLSHDKGTYVGKKDEELSAEQKNALQRRMRIQRGGGI